MQIYIWLATLKKSSYQAGPNENAFHGLRLWSNKQNIFFKGLMKSLQLAHHIGVFLIPINKITYEITTGNIIPL